MIALTQMTKLTSKIKRAVKRFFVKAPGEIESPAESFAAGIAMLVCLVVFVVLISMIGGR